MDKGYEGKFIGIYGKNSVNWMLCDVAIMGYVGSSVGLSKDLSYENLYYCIKKAELSLLIYDEEKETVVEKLKKGIRTCPKCKKDTLWWNPMSRNQYPK